MDIKVNISNIIGFVSNTEIQNYQPYIDKYKAGLFQKTGAGSEFTGWIDLPSQIEFSLLDQIANDVELIKKKAEIHVVIGIGGSYLGAKALIEALRNPFYGMKGKEKYPYIIFAGQTLSEDYYFELLELLNNKDYCITVISKSGTTTEPAVAFRLLKLHIENKYGKEEARKRIIAITDKSKGALKELADSEGYRTYVIPDDVGGRYSVLTPVGLLPFASAGFDINKLLQGAIDMQTFNASQNDVFSNPINLYAAIRNILYQKGKKIEIMVSYVPALSCFAEWWKQLFGESEGKNGKGIFPASVSNTTDLHSMGQYIQDGERNLFETVLTIENPKNIITIPNDYANNDRLNFLSGKRISEVNKMAELGTMIAHVDGNVPNIQISIPHLNEYYLGQLIYFYEFSCALSGYILGVNPFNQPGVEEYKINMFALLGKPGVEEKTKELLKRINRND